jgi:hypothetical protein
MTWLIARSLRMSAERMAGWLEDLRAVKVEPYYPMIREMKPVPLRMLTPAQRDVGSRPMRARVVPFLPQSVFVRGPDVVGALEDRRVKAGAIGLMPFGEGLARVPDWQIDKLKRREIDGVIPGASSAEWVFGVNDAIEVVNGAFTGLQGIVEVPPNCEIQDVDEKTRLRIALRIFAGRMTRMDVAVGDIRKL